MNPQLGRWMFPSLFEAGGYLSWLKWRLVIERVAAVIIKVSLRPSASVVDYLNTTSYSACDALFHNSALCFLSSETRHWLPNHCPITQLCGARLVSNKRSCRRWTSSGGATWLAGCVRPGLVSELHTKLDHWAEESSEILSECGGVCVVYEIILLQLHSYYLNTPSSVSVQWSNIYTIFTTSFKQSTWSMMTSGRYKNTKQINNQRKTSDSDQ